MKKKFLTWLKAAGVRAVKTFAQTFASLMTVGAVISELKWGYIASASAVAAIYSIATSIAGLPEVKNVNEAGEDVNDGYDEEDGI